MTDRTAPAELDVVSKLIFDGAVSATAGFRDLSPLLSLDEEASWTIHVEIIWFFLGVMFRDIWSLNPNTNVRDRAQDMLLPAIVESMVERMFGTLEPEAFDEQQENFVEWYIRAEESFGQLVDYWPTEHDLVEMFNSDGLPMTSLLAVMVSRVSEQIGRPDYVAFAPNLINTVLRTYGAFGIPIATTQLESLALESQQP